MKNLNSKTRRMAAVLLAAAILLGSSLLSAQDKSTDMIKKSKCAIGNLKSGIVSENVGLRKSSIYFAGEYRISEVVPQLISQLKKESDPQTRILIALVLYRIGDMNGLSLVKELGSKDSNYEVRRMCTSIYNAYITGASQNNITAKY